MKILTNMKTEDVYQKDVTWGCWILLSISFYYMVSANTLMCWVLVSRSVLALE